MWIRVRSGVTLRNVTYSGSGDGDHTQAQGQKHPQTKAQKWVAWGLQVQRIWGVQGSGTESLLGGACLNVPLGVCREALCPDVQGRGAGPTLGLPHRRGGG